MNDIRIPAARPVRAGRVVAPHQCQARSDDKRYRKAAERDGLPRRPAMFRREVARVGALQRDLDRQHRRRDHRHFGPGRARRLRRNQHQRRHDQHEQQQQQRLKPAIRHAAERENARLVDRDRDEQQPGERRRRAEFAQEEVGPGVHDCRPLRLLARHPATVCGARPQPRKRRRPGTTKERALADGEVAGGKLTCGGVDEVEGVGGAEGEQRAAVPVALQRHHRVGG